jgi:hypothetical protein
MYGKRKDFWFGGYFLDIILAGYSELGQIRNSQLKTVFSNIKKLSYFPFKAE